MLNPKLHNLLLKSINDIENVFRDQGDITSINICEAVKDLPADATTYTSELIKQTCELHNVAPVVMESIDGNYEIMKNMTQDEIKITARNYRKFIAANAINRIKNEAGSDPLVYVEKIKELELIDSTEAEDPDVYRTVKFGDINIKKVEETAGNVIPSCLSVVNDNTRGGYYTGQIVVFCGPPSCLFGDTEVMTLDHGKHTLESLYKSGKTDIEVYCCDEYGNLKVSKAEKCIITKYIKEYIELDIDGKIVKCTPDHLFMLNDGTWVQAKDLKPNDGLMPIHITKTHKDAVNYYNHSVNSVKLIKSDEEIPVYDLVNVDKYHNFAIYIDGDENLDSGIIVHNSGKSITMMNEVVNFCRNGLKVKYTAIGDMSEFDFVNRITGMTLDISMSSASLKSEVYFNLLLEKHPYLRDNLTLEFMAPDKFTIHDYVSKLKQSGEYDSIDVFVIDYDTNFASTKSDSMYEKGDEIYNEAKLLASRPGKLVLMGAQPKIGTWGDEILELNSLSESSRKQQIIDMMITISHPATPNGANHVGIINIAKNRRGSKGSCPYFLDKTGKVRCITKSDYEYFKHEEKPVTISKNPDGRSQSYNLGDAQKKALVEAGEINNQLSEQSKGFTINGLNL
jgi:hypothetical protein